MTPGDLSSLKDIYQVLLYPVTNIETSHILEFLWRDLTSSYDIVGLIYILYIRRVQICDSLYF